MKVRATVGGPMRRDQARVHRVSANVLGDSLGHVQRVVPLGDRRSTRRPSVCAQLLQREPDESLHDLLGGVS